MRNCILDSLNGFVIFIANFLVGSIMYFVSVVGPAFESHHYIFVRVITIENSQELRMQGFFLHIEDFADKRAF
jgi:hypothetical protein